MLKVKHILKVICTAIYIVKISYSLKLNDPGVCKITHNGTSTTQVRCCLHYRPHPTKDICISCPNGTFGEYCKSDCKDNYYGFLCLTECNCSGNETCYKATGCEATIYRNHENSSTQTNNTNSVLTVTLVAVVLVVIVFVSWKSRHRLKSINLLQRLFLRTQPVIVQSRYKTSDIEIEDDDPYSEIRESMMVRPPNTSEISNKTDFVIENKDNTTYAKVVKTSNNECSSKIPFNTIGIPDTSNFLTSTNKNEEISENSTKSKDHAAESEEEMTECESERKINSVQCEEDNSNNNIVLNKIMSDCEDTPVVISVSVGKQTIFVDLKDFNVLKSLSNDEILENAITSVQMSTNANKK